MIMTCETGSSRDGERSRGTRTSQSSMEWSGPRPAGYDAARSVSFTRNEDPIDGATTRPARRLDRRCWKTTRPAVKLCACFAPWPTAARKISSTTARWIDSLDQGDGLKSSLPPQPLRSSSSTAGMTQPPEERDGSVDGSVVKMGESRGSSCRGRYTTKCRVHLPTNSDHSWFAATYIPSAVMPRFCFVQGPSKTHDNNEVEMTSRTLLAKPPAASRRRQCRYSKTTSHEQMMAI
jgi:hypothetical protein